ncbi:MAG: hypothetical protein HQL11_04450, partial [Candidatus Omnitrophica bacterium]|nr:hypothetical protein [Candidatus Omnitrophota bacterium]
MPTAFAAKTKWDWIGVYHWFCVAALLTIELAANAVGEQNLPPLEPALRYWILFLFFQWAVVYFVWASRKDAGLLSRAQWVLWIAAAAALSWMRPVFSGDLYEYLIRGRILGLYGQSPYIALPRDFPNDLFRPFCVWRLNPDSYGPLSVYLQTLPAVLASKSLRGTIWAYKLMLLLFVAAANFAFVRITQLTPGPDAGRKRSLFVFAPLVVLSAFVDGHNDVIMMALSVISVCALLKKRFTLSFVLWTMSFLVKYMVVIQLPLMILYAVRHRLEEDRRFPWAWLFRQLALIAGISALLFWPIWGGAGTFLAILRAAPLCYSNTFPYAILQGLQVLGLNCPQSLLRYGLLAVYAVFYGVIMVRLWKSGCRSTPEFFKGLALAYGGFYLWMSTPFGFWYLLWALPWVILADWKRPVLVNVLYTMIGMLAFYKRIKYLFIL